ncbi:hypothetical protein N7470_002273 [Penicillium chermesinum]|nr:hypothetical protein N7470_002273 [Penicillium chermesinum]
MCPELDASHVLVLMQASTTDYALCEMVGMDVSSDGMDREIEERGLREGPLASRAYGTIGLSVMTPRVLPSRNASNPYLQHWWPMALTDQALLQAVVLSSLSHERINGWLSAKPGGLSIDSYILPGLETCYSEAVATLNGVLRDPRRATTDTTILAVLMMLEKPITKHHDKWIKKSPFQAPLQGLQWLNVHSAREPDLQHQMGLCKLIHMRGGLANIETPGLAAAAFYRVLVNSTLLLCRPSLPFCALSDQRTSELYIPIGATDSLDILDGIGLSPVVHQVMRELKAYTSIIEQYMEGSSPTYGAPAICDMRNLVQYHLMSIGPVCSTRLNDLSEVCRLATIIYSVGVTFPPSWRQYALRDTLKKGDILLLWVLAMGGIAAPDRATRDWFIESFAEVMYCSQNVQWRRLGPKLQMILWSESACNAAGTELWSEAYSLLQQRAEKHSSVLRDISLRIVRPGYRAFLRVRYHVIYAGGGESGVIKGDLVNAVRMEALNALTQMADWSGLGRKWVGFHNRIF